MNWKPVFLAVLATSMSAAAQDTALLPTRPIETLKGNVASCTETVYQIHVMKYVFVNDSATTTAIDTSVMGIAWVEKIKYDETGRKTERIIQTPTGPVRGMSSSSSSGNIQIYQGRVIDGNSPVSKTFWRYDSHGNNSGVSHEDELGTGLNFDQEYNIEYTADGWIAARSGSRYFRTGARVDSIQRNGVTVETWVYSDENGSYRIPQTGQAYVYDSGHRLVSQTTRDGRELNTVYNEHGDMLFDDEDRIRDNETRRTRYDSYEYDENGNWTHRTTSYLNEETGEWMPSLESFRIIEYRTAAAVSKSPSSGVIPAKKFD